MQDISGVVPWRTEINVSGVGFQPMRETSSGARRPAQNSGLPRYPGIRLQTRALGAINHQGTGPSLEMLPETNFANFPFSEERCHISVGRCDVEMHAHLVRRISSGKENLEREGGRNKI